MEGTAERDKPHRPGSVSTRVSVSVRVRVSVRAGVGNYFSPNERQKIFARPKV